MIAVIDKQYCYFCDSKSVELYCQKDVHFLVYLKDIYRYCAEQKESGSSNCLSLCVCMCICVASCVTVELSQLFQHFR